MPHLKVTLYIRITTPQGKRKMCARSTLHGVAASRFALRTQGATALDIIRGANTTCAMRANGKRSVTIPALPSTDSNNVSLN